MARRMGGDGAAASGGGVKSARRALELLELLAERERPMSFAELEATLSFPRSSLHGLVRTLAARGWLETGPNGRYRLGIRAWEVGAAYPGARSLVDRALPAMEAVRDATGETVQLAVLEGTQNVYLARVDGVHRLTLASDVGRRLDAHATGVGKALLSGLSDGKLAELYAGQKLATYTAHTTSTVPELLDAVAQVREVGYALDRQEYTLGVECVAVPINDAHGDVVAGMSVSVPTVRFDEGLREHILKCLRSAAEDLSRGLGRSG